jgi:hypothetical protein
MAERQALGIGAPAAFADRAPDLARRRPFERVPLERAGFSR